jgi:hypothetical protein
LYIRESYDDVKDSIYKELGHVSDQFPRYDINILLGDYSAKVGTEDIFKPTIGNETHTKLVTIMESQ